MVPVCTLTVSTLWSALTLQSALFVFSLILLFVLQNQLISLLLHEPHIILQLLSITYQIVFELSVSPSPVSSLHRKNRILVIASQGFHKWFTKLRFSLLYYTYAQITGSLSKYKGEKRNSFSPPHQVRLILSCCGARLLLHQETVLSVIAWVGCFRVLWDCRGP